MSLNIVSRSLWHAQAVFDSVNLKEIQFPVKNVFFTYTNTVECENLSACGNILRNLQDKAIKKKFLDDVYYNFIIGGDGYVYEGRGWLHYPILPMRHQDLTEESIYIAFFGQFLDSRPGDKLRKARFDLLQHGVEMGFLEKDFNRHDIIYKPRPFRENYDMNKQYNREFAQYTQQNLNRPRNTMYNNTYP